MASCNAALTPDLIEKIIEYIVPKKINIMGAKFLAAFQTKKGSTDFDGDVIFRELGGYDLLKQPTQKQIDDGEASPNSLKYSSSSHNIREEPISYQSMKIAKNGLEF